MKTILSFCSAALIALGTQAQPTLTAATNTPQPGGGYTINYGPYVPPGGTGANQTWNLAGLATDSSITVERVPPSTTTNGGQFPTATVAEVSDAVTQYYRVAADGIHFAGSDDGNTVIVHVPMGTYLPFPCTYGTVWSSPQHATFTCEGMTVTRTGTFSGNVDGHGTLIMPNGTINNVLRVRWTHTLQDAMGPITINHLYDSYVFFKVGQAHPIAELVTATINMGGGPITNQFSRWTGDISTYRRAAGHYAIGVPQPGQRRCGDAEVALLLRHAERRIGGGHGRAYRAARIPQGHVWYQRAPAHRLALPRHVPSHAGGQRWTSNHYGVGGALIRTCGPWAGGVDPGLRSSTTTCQARIHSLACSRRLPIRSGSVSF